MNEFELIYQTFLTQRAGYDSAHHFANIIKSIGDDAAVIIPPVGQQLVTCTDTLVQGRHFSQAWQQIEQLAFDIGYKSVAVNLSDLAAMGAKPHSILLALALPQRLANANWLDKFAKGLFCACDEAGVALIGGDTTRSEQLVITVTAQGFAQQCVYRHGANVGDQLFVSGTIGDAAYALHHLDSPLANRLHQPTARTALGLYLADKATAMIDISDGLAQDLGHILSQSQVGANLYLDTLPTSTLLSQIKLSERLPYQLTGGDDYELLFTLPAKIADNIKVADLPTPITHIGEITTSLDLQLYYHGKLITPSQPTLFDHFPSLTGYQHFG